LTKELQINSKGGNLNFTSPATAFDGRSINSIISGMSKNGSKKEIAKFSAGNNKANNANGNLKLRIDNSNYFGNLSHIDLNLET
jgi:hypothetical protein